MKLTNLFFILALTSATHEAVQAIPLRNALTFSPASTDVVLADKGNVTVASYTDAVVSVEGKTNLFLTDATPLSGSNIDLKGHDAWLYFTQVKPSVVSGTLCQYVTIDGRAYDDKRDRLAIYGSGTVLIPYGKEVAEEALIAYTGKNFTGESRTFNINTYHNNLGDFDNKIQSFKLKKGFSATLANGADGSGFSRVFIASDEDIEMPEMPEGMENFVSFVRVFKWEWTAKKGWAGAPSDQLNVSISYDWGAGASTDNMDTEYVPMRHNLGWESFSVINARNNVSHLLGYNEPDRSDQSHMDVADAIEQWPELFKSGLRLGSPAPSSSPHKWLNQFMAICDSLNYRVDFVVTHAYQNQATSWWDWNIGATSKNANGRPVWITEWNNGANWTSESWPTAEGPKRDANFNLVLDEDGNEITVRRPHDEANSQRSVTKMNQVLPFFDSYDLLEHHFLYNWVQDARSMMLDDVLTPAGKVFANFQSEVGFKKKNEYIHTWKIAPPWVKMSLSDDYKSVNLSWYDHNGETGKQYVLQRKVDGGKYSIVKVFNMNEDYECGGTITYNEPLQGDTAIYRVFAVSYKDMRSLYSRELVMARDAKPTTPVAAGEPVCASILRLTWNEVTSARSYRVERASSADGDYEVIADYLEATEFEDEKLTDNTTYYYRVLALNSYGEGEPSAVVQLATKEYQVPAAIEGLRVSSGDARNTFTWHYVLDTNYDVYRSESKEGEYVKWAENVQVERDKAVYVDSVKVQNGKTYYYKLQPVNKAGQAALSSVVTAQPQAGRVLCLRFNEGEGTEVFDEWGGFNATLCNDAAWSTNTEGDSVKNTVLLDKTNKSHIQLAEGVVQSLHTNYTISTWVYLPEDQGNNTRLFDFGNGTGTFMVLIPQVSSGECRYKITYKTGEGDNIKQHTYSVNLKADIPKGEWSHVTFTCSEHPQGGLLYMIYVNGMPKSFARDLDNVTPDGMGKTLYNYLGRSQWPNDPYCAHGYKDFRIYNVTLTPKEVKALYQGTEPTITSIQPTVSETSFTQLDVTPRSVQRGENIQITVANTIQDHAVSQWVVYNMNGVAMSQGNLVNGRAQVTAPAQPGVYVVKVWGAGDVQSARIIVK